MTPQESAMLQDLLARVKGTSLAEKDPEAEAAIQQSIGNNPDSLYILAQTVLVQNIALGQARAQLDQLKQQVSELQQAPHPSRASSFLGALLGHSDPPPPPPPQVRPAPASPQYIAPPYQQVAGYPPPAFTPFGGGSPSGSMLGGGFGGPPSFLRSAATTAAGVAAGALAFEGVESLLHGFGHGGGGFGGNAFGGGGFGGAPVEENVVNNYYDGSGSGTELHDHHQLESAYDERPDAASHQGDAARFDDTGYGALDLPSDDKDGNYTGGDYTGLGLQDDPASRDFTSGSADLGANDLGANDLGANDLTSSDLNTSDLASSEDVPYSEVSSGDSFGGDDSGGSFGDGGGGDLG
ncbi:MAG TPA: DUF2076 domain-containing protein [Acidisarcina sp.]